MKKSSVPFLVFSLLIAAAGILIAVLKLGFVFNGTAASMINVTQMWLCMLAGVIFSLLYGFVRFDRAHAVALAFAALHDFLLTFALTAIATMVLPKMTSIPAASTLTTAIVVSIAFVYCQTMIVLREGRQVIRTTSRRDVTLEDAAGLAVSNSRALRVRVVVALLVLVLAVSLVGGMGLFVAFVPVIISIFVSFYSAEKLTPYVWASSAAVLKGRKVYK